MPLRLQTEENPQLNLTPMIDVLFLLIIFFVAGTRFAEMERQVDLNLPEVAAHAQLDDAKREYSIHVFREGGVTLDGVGVSLDELKTKVSDLRSRSPRATFVVRGDGEGQYQRVAEVMSCCREAGVSNLAMAVRTRDGGKR